ncbi:hypothetical protein CAPTEDRAFT_228436 [Capitella teleta]|uniref:G-protein coupled receptors family 1 profile domain-containing protein n=1 Tax=Capitella teleta TaxID=283909 RepID=R7VKG9_CAPTE|nr:hypothetical protein CAPTEDRAFT_228436 [Capitella teleta]|eukprot:ELU17361.1 hypothetical protein CAPTEDRAFT_228436 [Capitella teleta]
MEAQSVAVAMEVCMAIMTTNLNQSQHNTSIDPASQIGVNDDLVAHCSAQLKDMKSALHHTYIREMIIYYLMGIGGTSVCCMGLIGNIVSLVVLSQRSMRSSTYSYLAALAVCDLLVLVCTLALLAKDVNRPVEGQQRWPWDEGVYPHLFPILHPAAFTFQVTSVWLTLAFTVDRYIMICHPFEAEPFCTVSRARKVIATLCVASIIFNIPKYFEYKTLDIVVNPVANVTRVGCDLTNFGKSHIFRQLYHSWFYITFVCGVPFVSLAVLNSFLIHAVHLSRQRGKEINSAERKRNDTTIMLISVVVVFFICQMPALVSRTIWAFEDDPNAFRRLHLYALNEIGNFLIILNSSVNIVPYYFFGQRFRRQFWRIFCRCLLKNKRFQTLTASYSISEHQHLHVQAHRHGSSGSVMQQYELNTHRLRPPGNSRIKRASAESPSPAEGGTVLWDRMVLNLTSIIHVRAARMVVLRVGLSDHRYIAFEHSRAWLIHSYKKVGDNTVDLVDGSRMEQLLKAPIQAGKSWPEPVNVEGDEEGEVNRKRKAAEEEEEEEEEGQGKRLRVEDQSEICFEEGPARDENSAAEDILSQPGVHNTFYGTPNAAELMSGNRAKKNVEEKRKRKEEQKAKEKLKLKEEEEKRKEEEERERKKAEEERKRRQAEEEEIIAAEMRREADEAAEEEEETEDKIEVVIQSRTPDEPPGGEELMVLAKMAKTENRQPPACRKAKQLPKRNTRVRATTSTCPEAQHLVALARLAEQDKKKASKKPRSVTRKTSPPAAQPPKTPEAKKLVSVLKPDIRKKLPQVDGPGEDAAENTYLGSFNRVRLVCRPWRVPSGGINRPVLRLMLEAVCMQTITRPGVTVQSLFTFFQPALHITPILELVEILECVGCVERKFIQRESRSSLFSKRIVYSDVPCGSNLQAEAAIIPKIDCILKLGHFLQMLSEDF